MDIPMVSNINPVYTILQVGNKNVQKNEWVEIYKKKTIVCKIRLKHFYDRKNINITIF